MLWNDKKYGLKHEEVKPKSNVTKTKTLFKLRSSWQRLLFTKLYKNQPNQKT